MTTHNPTPEQAAIIDAAADGKNLVVEAGAGTGKTSTLKMLAAAKPGQRGVYLAYNRSIADQAGREFPQRVTCKTAHGFAYGVVARPYAHRLRAPRLPARETALILGINEPIRLAEDLAPLAPQQLARIVTATVDRFCHSADEEIGERHVPKYPGLDAPLVHRELARAIAPWAVKAWEDLTRTDGRLRFTHDCYLKMWQLSRPQLPADYVLLDEAQDANPAVAAIVEGQYGQKILVGDRCQSIYGWRGAVDAMEHFDGDRFYLSHSFRFGGAIAGEANKWLAILNSPLRLRGFDQVPSTVGALAEPDAILCRSNSAAISRLMDAIDAGRRPALVGGGSDIRRLAEAAQRLKAGLGCDHPELFAFSSWREVQDYVEQDSTGSDLKVFVDLIDRLGADTIIRVVDQLAEERYADVVVSTAHKAKGREWPRVQIATDFREPKDREDGTPGVVTREDAMLAYVAVTRAQLVLDREGLAWVDRWVPVGADYLPDPAARIAAVAEVAPEYVRQVEPKPEPVGDANAALLAEVLAAGPTPQPAGCTAGGTSPCFLCDPDVRASWPAPLQAGALR